jgi:hypothetical protein
MSVVAETPDVTSQDARRAPGLCWDCNYSLQGLAEPRCPECGRPFDLANPGSFNQGKALGPVARRLLRSAPWYGWLIRTYCCIAIVIAAILPMDRWTAVRCFFVFWILLGIPYFVRRILRLAAIRQHDQPAASSRVDDAMTRRVGRWTLWTALALFAQLPLYLAFAVSAPPLQNLAEQRYEKMPFPAVNGMPLARRQYGLFRVARVWVEPSGVDLRLWWNGYDAPGLRYAPGNASLNRILRGTQLTHSWQIRE